MTLQQMQMVMGDAAGGSVAISGQGAIIAYDMEVDPGNAARTVAAPAQTLAGDILVAFAAVGPDYLGQSGITLRTPTFQVWNVAGTGINGTIDSSLCCAIFVREATGTSEDDCLIFAAGSHHPLFLNVCVFTSPGFYPGNPATIFAGGSVLRTPADTDFHRTGITATWTDCLDTYITARKAGEPGDEGLTAGGTDQGIIWLGEVNTEPNAVNRGLIASWGYYPDQGAKITPAGDWSIGMTPPARDSYAVSARIKHAGSF